ncbi:MAG: dihydroorotate dehydrogenase [Planctomycetota bacterium]
MDASVRTSLAGIDLATPVLLAAGTAGTLAEMAGVVDLSRVGGVVTKSITRRPRDGNETWRIIESKAGMLNAIGLANPGAEAFERDVAPLAAGLPTKVIGSVAGFTIDDYVHVAGMMDGVDAIEAVELNVSCPNVDHANAEFGADPRALGELVRAVRPALERTKLFVKLSPVAIGTPATIVDIAGAAIEAGADGLCISNTVPAMGIDVRTRRPKLANVTGGLSGPAVHAIAVRLVHLVHREVARDAGVPIVGIGGVLRWDDAAEFILAGATAVQVGTGLFVDPRSPVKIAKGLAKWCANQGVASINELVGAVEAG